MVKFSIIGNKKKYIYFDAKFLEKFVFCQFIFLKLYSKMYTMLYFIFHIEVKFFE